jgi:hypothetical protein
MSNINATSNTYNQMISQIDHSVTKKYLPKENIENKQISSVPDSMEIKNNKDPIIKKSGDITVQLYESSVEDSNPIETSSNDYIFINGIFNDEDSAGDSLDELNSIVRDKGVEFKLFHNPTSSILDIGEASINLLDIQGASTKIAKKLAARILEDFKKNKAPVIAAHSQGAAITADALNYVRNQLLEQGLSASEISKKMATVKVITLGGFAHQQDFPREISLTRITNKNDPVPKISSTKTRNFDDAIFEGKYFIKHAKNTAPNVFAKGVIALSLGVSLPLVMNYRATKSALVGVYQTGKGVNDFINMPNLANGYGFLSNGRINAINEHSVIPGYLKNEYVKSSIRNFVP